MTVPVSLPTRLALLVLVSMLPLLALSLFKAFSETRAAVTRAADSLQLTASLVAIHQSQVSESTLHLLKTIAVVRSIREGDLPRCNDYLSSVKRQLPAYSSISTIGADGYVQCSAILLNGPLYLGDRAEVRQTLTGQGLVSGTYREGVLPGKGVLPFAYPIVNAEGKTMSVVYITLDLQEMSKSFAGITIPSGASIGIHDRNGTLLAGSSNLPLRIGEKGVSPVFLAALREWVAGVAEGPDSSGEQRLWAFSPGNRAASAAFFVAVSAPRSLYALPIYRELAIELLAMLVITLCGGLIVWMLGRKLIIWPIREVRRATLGLEAGDLHERVALARVGSSQEFRGIAKSFNQMADALQRREEDLKIELNHTQRAQIALDKAQQVQAQSYAKLREAQLRLVDAQRLCRIGHWEFDLTSQKITLSDEIYELFGLMPGSFDGSHETFLQMIHPADRADYEQRRQHATLCGAELDIEYRVVTPDGAVRWLHQLGRSHLNDEGMTAYRAGVVQEITTRKESELALAATADLLRRTGEMAVVGGWELILDGMQLICSDQMLRIHDLEPGSRLTMEDARDAYVLGARRVFVAAAEAATANGTPWDLELSLTTARGRTIWVRSQGQAVMKDGVVHKLTGAVQDITQRKRAEQALVESEQRYTALFETAPVPMWVIDRETGRFLMVNSAAVKAYGYSNEELLSMTLLDIRPASEHERLRKELVDAVPESERKETWLHRRKDGSVFPVNIFARSIQYGSKGSWFIVALDVTFQVEAEKVIQEHLFTLQRAADAAQAITWHQALEGTLQEVVEQARGVIGANQAVVSLAAGNDFPIMMAVSLAEKYAPYRDLIKQPDGNGLYAMAFESSRALRMTQAELEARPRWRGYGVYTDKHPPMRGWLAVPLMSRSGKNMGVLQLSDKYEGEFTLQDEYVAIELAQLASIAIQNAQLIEEVNQLNTGLERKVAERTVALARQEALFRALAEQAPQVVWTINPKGQVTYFNRAWFDLVGGDLQDWAGTRWFDAMHPEDLPDMQANWKGAMASSLPYVGIRRVRSKNGNYHTMSYRASPVLNNQGEVSFWVGIDADITEMKTVEAALRLSNEELEAFAYSVSHDLRSPLNTVDGFSRLLAKQVNSDPNLKVQHYLSRIQAGVAQMGRLIEDLLSLSQVTRMHLRYEEVDLSALGHRVVDGWKARQPGRQAAVHIEEGLTAQCDGRLIKILMGNLIGNAWKFTSMADEARIYVGQTLDAAGQPEFFVRDNGVGFDMAYADKLFVAFQRLHAVSEFPGTGIGLATVGRVVSRHGGRVWAESVLGRGATFFFTLPFTVLAS